MKNNFTLFLIMICSFCLVAQGNLPIPAADSLFTHGDYKNAQPIYEKELKKNPVNALAWNRLGFCYHNLKDYKNAVRCYTTALQHGPSPQLLPFVYSRLGRVYALQSEKDKAFESLNKAIEVSYGNFNELNTHDDFKNIRSDSRFAKVVEAATANAFPCMGDPKNHEFDFWIGEWDVFLTQNANVKVGFNKIYRLPGGCSLLENWEATGVPNVGQSINYYDAGSGKWEQLWVGSGGGSKSGGVNIGRFYDGAFSNNAMQFKYDGTGPNGQKMNGRLTFTQLEPGKVRQHNESSVDGGTTWTTVYDFTYVLRK